MLSVTKRFLDDIAGKILFVVGPTAVGKSDFAIALALETGGEIVSADSMQVYKGFDTGTAKPSAEERSHVPHHMIDVWDPADTEKDFSAAAYSEQAKEIIADIFARGKQPVVCGGSGLYIHSLLYELDFAGEERDTELREELRREAEEKGGEYLFAKLEELDPNAALHVHPNNTKRVIRALERVRGNAESGGLRRFDMTYDARVPSHVFRLVRDRARLYERIEHRAESFFAAGLVDEVRALLKSGVPKDGTAMQGIGYKEITVMLDGGYDETEALRLVKQNSRHYAKRQETWFKRYRNVEIIEIV